MSLARPILALAAFASSLTVVAQQTPTLHLESRLVTLALSVTDVRDVPVAKLAASDFELTEDDRPERIAFFDQASDAPLDLVFVVDASESVAPWQQLERDAARSFLRSIAVQQDRIALVAFSDTVTEPVAFTTNPHRIEAALLHMHRGQATALYDAVSFASQRLADLLAAPNARRVLVLITDGENTTRHGSYDSALEAAQRAGAVIYPLILIPVAADAGRNTGGEHALMQLAADTGGKSYAVEQDADLASALHRVAADLRSQYVLGYYPKPADAVPSVRHIRLQLIDPTLAARYALRYRNSYYASARP